ncbi:RES domain-containing protein [Psychrobacter sp. PAMC 21119]|uniref:RES domain-containing protein n=1 Tax=Psychrobacter sp. PAMC 21119 TaxID=1112209 RepID=UPI00028844F4|nr:RES domain-containing protein [Psychrobacter sp. PAMC 21119]
MSYVCSDCVNIESIKKEGVYSSEEKICFYCNKNKVEVIDRNDVIALLSSRFLEAVVPFSECSEHEQGMYFFAHDETLNPSDIFNMIDWLELGSEQLRDDLYCEIEKSLGSEYEDLFVYDDGTLDDGNEYEAKWDTFIRSIHHKHRFFNHNAKTFLDSLFALIHEDGKIIDTVIYELNPNTPIFRARIANTVEERTAIYSDPASQLGAVPTMLAGEQRMTPTGISAFYASDSRETCFSEVRATTGDIVMSAEFRATDTLRLLDLSKLKEVSQMSVCPFDKDFVDKSHKSYFIQRLVFLLSKPASQRKNSVYLETQVIFEYFRTYFSEGIYGIAFNSVQNGMEGMNIALFPEYSKVSSFSYNNKEITGCKEYVNKEFNFYSYSVETGIENNISIKKDEYLRFIDKSILLHHVTAVKTITQDFEVEGHVDE